MKKKLIVAIVGMILGLGVLSAALFFAMKSDNATEEATATPTPTPEATVTPTPTPEAAVTPTPIPEATVTPTPTPETTVTPTPTPEATATPIPTPESTATPTIEPVDTPVPQWDWSQATMEDIDAYANIQDAEDAALNGADLYHARTVTAKCGVEIPVLNQFNCAGISDFVPTAFDNTQDWFGYVGDESAAGYVNSKETSDAMAQLRETLEINGFHVQLDQMKAKIMGHWDFDGEVTLIRPSDYYVFAVNHDFRNPLTYYQGDDYHAVTIGMDEGYDMVLMLCSVISSQPDVLAQAIMDACFGDNPAGISSTEWTTVGDCQILYVRRMYEYYASAFAIIPAN